MLERAWMAAHTLPLFPSWWVFELVAILAGGLVVAQASRRLLVPFATGVVCAGALAVLLGSGRAWTSFVARGLRGPLPDVEIAGFGALAGLTLGLVLSARRRGMDVRGALDTLAPAIGAMLAVARIGCFFAGCDFGAPTTLPWALRYPHFTPAFRAQLGAGLVTSNAIATLPVHPTQLYEALLGALLFVVAKIFPRGARFERVIVGYAVGRALVDLVRGDLPRGWLGLTPSQLLGLAAVGLVVAQRATRFTITLPTE